MSQSTIRSFSASFRSRSSCRVVSVASPAILVPRTFFLRRGELARRARSPLLVVKAAQRAPAPAAPRPAAPGDAGGSRSRRAVEGVAVGVEDRAADRALHRGVRDALAPAEGRAAGAEAHDRVRFRDREQPGRLCPLLAR